MMAFEPTISGRCDDDFIAVRDAFRQNFVERGEVGAALCVIRDGEVVVDVCAGWADEGRTRPWTHDTLVNFYSVGKAIVATLVLQLVDRGIITLDTRVADIWPEFAAGGKHDVTVRHALCHRAGVPAIRQRLTDDDLFDWPVMADALAATETWWPIDTRHAYHTNTYGHLTGEIIRRATGEMPGTALRRVADEIDADVWIGVPDDHHPRCADVIWAPSSHVDPTAIDTSALDGDALMNVLAHFNPPGYSSIGLVNTARWRSGQVPSTNGHGTAHGLATFYSALLQADRLLSPRPADARHPAAVERHVSDPRRGRRVRSGVRTHDSTPAARNESAQLRPLRHRRRAGFRRPRHRHRLRVRDEPRHPAMAEHQEPGTDRQPLRRSTSPS